MVLTAEVLIEEKDRFVCWLEFTIESGEEGGIGEEALEEAAVEEEVEEEEEEEEKFGSV